MGTVKRIFVAVFVAAFFLQWFGWSAGITDGSLWENEAKYVQTGDVAHEFDFFGAYGHPGGPIIEGVIAAHTVLRIPYDDVIIPFLCIVDALLIALATVLCYLLRPKYLWWLVAAAVLSLNSNFFQYATPPSAIASLLLVVLSLYALWLYERPDAASSRFVLWGAVAGLAGATRAPESAVIFTALLLLLWSRFGWRKAVYAAAAAGAVFVLADPFMLFMPVRHLGDLFHKAFLHYAEFAPAPLAPGTLIAFSSLSFISVFLAVATASLRRKISDSIPPRYLAVLLVFTVALSVIFLTARYESARYFLPLTLLWEALLPLFLFQLLPFMRFSFLKTADGQRLAALFMAAFVFGYLVLSQALLLLFSVSASLSFVR